MGWVWHNFGGPSEFRGGGVEPPHHGYATALAHFLVWAFPVLKKHLTRYGTDPMTWDSVVVMEIRLWTGQSRVRILAGASDFCFLQTIQNGSGAQPTSYSVGTRFISWMYRGQGTMLTTRLHLALRLRLSRAVPVLFYMLFCRGQAQLNQTQFCLFLVGPSERYWAFLCCCHLHVTECDVDFENAS